MCFVDMESHNSLTALKATQPAAPGPFATPRPQSTCWHHLHVLADKGASCTQQGELSFSCQSLLLIAAHRTALASCYVDQLRKGFPFSPLTHYSAQSILQLRFSPSFISQQEYLLFHPSWPPSPRAEQSACWALVLDQWPAYWSVTSRSPDQTPSGIWSQDLHTLGSYDWQLKICPEDRMAKNGDSKWPRIECRKLRQGCQVNLPQEQFPGKFTGNPGVTIMWPRRQLENGPLTYSGRNI